MRPVFYPLFLFFSLASSSALQAANRYWIATATANWNSTTNWSTTATGAGGFSVPASGDIANFTSSRVGNCTIDASVNISSLVVNTGYTGTITQGTNPITISGAASFAAGTFTGGTGTMTIGGAVSLTGTTFVFPSLLDMNGNAWTYASGTLDPMTNASTVVFGDGITLTGTETLNNISFTNSTPYTMTFTLATGTTLTANGNMALSGVSATVFTGGTIDLLGNLNLTNTGTGGSGSTVIAFVGTGAQAITSSLSLNQGSLPSVNIDKPSGTLTFPSLFSVGGNSWTYTAGTLDVTTNSSTVVFNSNTTITGSHTLNSINVNNATPYTQILTLTAGTTVTAGGNMTISGISSILLNGGTIDLLGNMSLTNTGTSGGGSTVISFAGTTNQAITSSLTIDQDNLPSVNIDKASGTLTFPSLLSMAGNTWTYTMGALDVTTNNSTVVFDGNTSFSGSHTLNNIDFDNPTPYTQVLIFATGTTVTANGNLTLSGISSMIFNGAGSIGLLGNLHLTNTGTSGGGSAVIAFTGTTNQAITSSLTIDQSSLPSVNIDKPSGTLTFPALITVTGSTWTYTTGAMDVTTNNSTVVFGGNTTFTGSHTLNNIDLDNATPYSQLLTFNTGTTVTASGNLTISGISSIEFSGGAIDLFGNLILTNTGTNGGGSTAITFVSSANQSIISSLTIYQSSLPSVTISKPAGTLIFPALLTSAGNAWTYTTGALDVTTNNSTVVFGSNGTTFTGNHTLNNIDFDNSSPYSNYYTFATGTTMTASGNMAMSGISSLIFSGGTIDLLGNLNLTNISANDGGSTVVTFLSSTNQAINSTLPEGESGLPSINIDKTGGTLSLPSLLTMAGSAWTYTAGTVDAGTAASTVYFTATTNIKSAGMNFYNVNVVSNTNTLGNNLSANSNITISGTGVLAPGANTISLLGNWSDRSTAGFTESTSTVSFNGSSVQTITAPGGENFAGLTVNNTGAGIQLENNITLSKTLTMTQGNIDLNSNNLTIGQSTAANGALAYTSGTIINGGSITRWFKAGVIATGSAVGLFPVGTIANYRPFSVSAPTSGPTTGGAMTLVYTDASTIAGVNFPDGAFNVQVRTNLNWALTTQFGLNGGTYDLGISGTGYQTIANVNDLRLTLAGSVVGTAGVNGGTTSNPQVNRTGLTLANLTNTFYLGSVNPTMTTLPVSLISFTAALSNGGVVLDWSTAEETNSAYYTIQRSADGISWENLQQVDAAGTSNSTIDYTALDASPLTGVSLYRLMITDRDGGTTYSTIRSVNFSSQVSGITVYPNPAVDYLTIGFVHTGNYQVTLLNDLGQVVTGGISPNGSSSLVLNVTALRPGVYFVHIAGTAFTETRTLLIRR